MLLAAERICYHSCHVSTNDVNCRVTLPTFLVPIYAVRTGSFRQRLIFLHRPLVQEHATNKNEKINGSRPFFVGSLFKFGVNQQNTKFFAPSAFACIFNVTKSSCNFKELSASYYKGREGEFKTYPLYLRITLTYKYVKKILFCTVTKHN